RLPFPPALSVCHAPLRRRGAAHQGGGGGTQRRLSSVLRRAFRSSRSEQRRRDCSGTVPKNEGSPMKCLPRVMLRLTACVAVLALMGAAASAEDVLKVAVGQITNWENQPATLGMQAGIFQKHGLALQTFGTQGAGETLQPIIAGSADIGV